MNVLWSVYWRMKGSNSVVQPEASTAKKNLIFSECLLNISYNRNALFRLKHMYEYGNVIPSIMFMKTRIVGTNMLFSCSAKGGKSHGGL